MGIHAWKRPNPSKCAQIPKGESMGLKKYLCKYLRISKLWDVLFIKTKGLQQQLCNFFALWETFLRKKNLWGVLDNPNDPNF